jgi:hypothetical protein
MIDRRKEVEGMKEQQDMKKMIAQLEKLHKRIDYMEKEMYEIRKGNTMGEY